MPTEDWGSAHPGEGPARPEQGLQVLFDRLRDGIPDGPEFAYLTRKATPLIFGMVDAVAEAFDVDEAQVREQLVERRLPELG